MTLLAGQPATQVLAEVHHRFAEHLYAKGDYDQALDCHTKALGITRAALGEDHPDTATSYSNLFNLRRAKGHPRFSMTLS